MRYDQDSTVLLLPLGPCQAFCVRVCALHVADCSRRVVVSVSGPLPRARAAVRHPLRNRAISSNSQPQARSKPPRRVTRVDAIGPKINKRSTNKSTPVLNLNLSLPPLPWTLQPLSPPLLRRRSGPHGPAARRGCSWRAPRRPTTTKTGSSLGPCQLFLTPIFLSISPTTSPPQRAASSTTWPVSSVPSLSASPAAVRSPRKVSRVSTTRAPALDASLAT
jgi:hypothetical protein